MALHKSGLQFSSFTHLGVLLILALLVSACGTHTFHQVKPNDTLYSVSWSYNQDYKQVARWNGLKPPYLIKPGEWLRVAPPTQDAWGQQYPPVPVRQPPVISAPPPKPVSKPQAPATQGPPSVTVKPVISRTASPSVSSSTDAPVWIWPSKGPVIRKFNASLSKRQGIDIGGKEGDEVRASAAGKVVYSGSGLRGYGHLIIIKHNARYLSAYAHNQLRLVKKDEMVKQGQIIARKGRSEADRVKLHFQIRVDGKPVDPLRYLPR